MKVSTIHIFGYGEAQIVSDTTNFKTAVGDFKKLQAVIDDVKSKKPADKTATDYHAINIFFDSKAVYIPKGDPKDAGLKASDNSFSVAFKDLDSKKIDALVAEFVTLSAKVPA